MVFIHTNTKLNSKHLLTVSVKSRSHIRVKPFKISNLDSDWLMEIIPSGYLVFYWPQQFTSISVGPRCGGIKRCPFLAGPSVILFGF